MRIEILIIVSVSVGLCAGCRKKDESAPEKQKQVLATLPAPQAELIARYHFVGAAQLATDTNSAKLQEIWRLPATHELADQTLRKLAKAPDELFRQRIPAATNDYSALIHPLLDDWLRAESYAELRGATNQTPELMLALRLNDNRAQLWSTNLATVLTTWSACRADDIQVGGFKGWELKKHHPPNLFQFVRAGEWVVMGLGQDKLAMQAEVLERIRRMRRPIPVGSNYWLTAWVDGPRLSPWLSLPRPIELSQTRLAVIGQGENLRTKINFVYPGGLAWSPQPWRIPTNEIREPLISFTAGQGIAPWLSRQKEFQGLKKDSVPNQFYFWAMRQIPFQTFVALPSQDTTNLMTHLGEQIVAACGTNLQQRGMGTIHWSTNNGGLLWEGLPFVAPYLHPIQDEKGSYLFGGFFANTPLKSALPFELLTQIIGRTNLVYYDWEITQERLAQWRNLSQLYRTIAGAPRTDTSAPAQQWIDAVGTNLGNTVTEVTVTAPNEMTLTRKSHIGFTGIEIVALTSWWESPAFPWGGYRWPSRSNEIAGSNVNSNRPPAKP